MSNYTEVSTATEAVYLEELNQIDHEVSPKGVFLDNRDEATAYKYLVIPLRLLAIAGGLFVLTKIFVTFFTPLFADNLSLDSQMFIGGFFGLVFLGINEYQKGVAVTKKARIESQLEEGKGVDDWVSQATRLKRELKGIKRKYYTTLTISLVATVMGVMLYIYETAPKAEIVDIDTYAAQEAAEKAAIQKKIDWNNEQKWSGGTVIAEHRQASLSLTASLPSITQKYQTLITNRMGVNSMAIQTAYEGKMKWVLLSAIFLLLVEWGIVYMLGFTERWKVLSVVEKRHGFVYIDPTANFYKAQVKNPKIAATTKPQAAPVIEEIEEEVIEEAPKETKAAPKPDKAQEKPFDSEPTVDELEKKIEIANASRYFSTNAKRAVKYLNSLKPIDTQLANLFKYETSHEYLTGESLAATSKHFMESEALRDAFEAYKKAQEQTS